MVRQDSTDKEIAVEGNSPGENKRHQLIANECRRLQKARAVLECLAVGLEYEQDIDFADVATVVSTLIGDAVANLDSSALKRRGGRRAQQRLTADKSVR